MQWATLLSSSSSSSSSGVNIEWHPSSDSCHVTVPYTPLWECRWGGVLSPRYWPWTRKWVYHKVCDMWSVHHQMVTFRASEHHLPLTGAKLYCLVTEPYSLPKATVQWCPDRLKPTTYESQVRYLTNSATTLGRTAGITVNITEYQLQLNKHKLRINTF